MLASEDSSSPTAQEKGGIARREALPPARRQEIARKAAIVRWTVPRATHEGVLEIGDVTMPCAVLENGVRVISERGVMRQLGTQRGGPAFRAATLDDGGVRLPMYLALRSLRPFIGNELAEVLVQPVLYRPLHGGKPAHGLNAELIPRVCEVWLNARDAGVLKGTQLRIAKKAETLIRGLARVGIIALVDEATGYQEVRDRLALQRILDAYLSRELAAWSRRFPSEFYRQIFRLREWEWDALKAKEKRGKGYGPRVIARYTNDFVYARLAPGILEELQRRNPINERGQRPAKHHQWLTQDVGNPALAQHLHAVIGLMRASRSWEDFKFMIDRAFPRRTDLDDLPLFAGTAL